MDNLDYGIIGNCQSGALISKNGSIDWCCLPQFDSPSVFAALLDENKGGFFAIEVDDSYTTEQKYINNTNILVTLFTNGKDSFEVIDCMPRYYNVDGTYYYPPDILRYFKYISGKPKFKVNYKPKLEYGQHETHNIVKNSYIKSNTSEGIYDSVYLYSDFNLKDINEGNTLTLNKDHFFLLSYNQKILEQNIERAYLKVQRTKVYWLNWVEKTVKYKQYNKEISRSALVLKLLSFDKTGAILAALTTSLPETIGEVRNWDYRFCWIRDSSMTIKILTQLGHMNIAKRYLKFIIDILPDKDEKIQIMYGIDGQKKLTETFLDHFEGYKGSSPVRIGNAAYEQKQNDIYGVLMDVIYQQFKMFETSLQHSENFWTITRSIVKIVEQNWQNPDRGIWEIRTDQKHFTFSKVLCWVAIDRAIKIADLLKMDEYVERWTPLRDEIKRDTLINAWNEKMEAFTQFYGSDEMDASNLLMEEYGFIDAKDPKYISTVLKTKEHLMNDGLMYRYKNKDDFGLPSSSFTICTFWMINSLYKIGKKRDAKKLFSQLLKYSNHLGLFSEDLDFKTKRLLGNFPQAYSHLALIETATTLNDGEIIDDEEIMENLHIHTEEIDN